MILPSFIRINKSDYSSDQQALVNQLANTLNVDIESLYNVLNGACNLANNIAGTLTSVTLTVDSNGNPTPSSSFNITANTTVIGIMVIKATNITSSTTYPTGAPFISYIQTGNTVKINNVTGLQANNQYTLQLFAWN